MYWPEILMSVLVACDTGVVLSNRLNIITLTSVNNGSSATDIMLPTFAVALDDMKERYPLVYENHSKVDLFWSVDEPMCKAEGDWLVPSKMAEWYNQGIFTRDGFTIILCAICSRAIEVVADFSRAWTREQIRVSYHHDLLITNWTSRLWHGKQKQIPTANLLPSSFWKSASGSTVNQTRAPHVISLAQTSVMIFGQAVGLIMDIFNWGYVVVIRDKLSKTVANGRNAIMCQGVLSDLQKRTDLQRLVLDVDSESSGYSFDDDLKKAASYSNIIVCCTLYKSMRRLLAAAHDLNMTKGDFVFMYQYQGEIPTESPLSKWRRSDSLDEKIEEALDTVIVIRTPETNWNIHLHRAERILRLREQLGFAPYDPSLLYNDFSVSCTGVVELMSQVLDEIRLDNSSVKPTVGMKYMTIVRKILRRTFFLNYENVTMDVDGARMADVRVQQYDKFLKSFMTVYSYNPSTKQYESQRPMKWKLGRVPMDRPKCDSCGSSALTTTLSIAFVAALVTLMIVMVAASIWRQQRKQEIRRTWWVVSDADFKAAFVQDVQPFKNKLKMALCASQAVLSCCSMETARFHSKKFMQFVNLRGTPAFRKQLYWTSSKAPVCTSSFLNFVAKMRKLDSVNVNGLLGLHIADSTPSSFYGVCQRGSLEDFLKQPEPDWVLKMSLIADIVKGLKVIHGSSIKKHGNLKSSKLLLDSHMAVKLTDYGHEDLTSFLGDLAVQTKDGPFFPLHCWMAPEVMRGHCATPESDVYAFSLIVHQIVMHCKVFNLGHHSPLNTYEIIDQIQMGERPYFRPTFLGRETSGLVWLTELLERCWDEAPASRPTISDISHTFRKATTSVDMESTLVDRVIKWLTSYNAVLEQDIAKRTGQLLQEQAKADALLSNMLPSDIVRKLRSGISVEPECVDDVSILFSDICGFNDFVATTPPIKVMAFLNEVYSCFDRTTAGLSVYKVETIGSNYMASSGLVERIGTAHVHEICQLSKLLKHAFINLNSRNNMATRIGIHSGQVAVGVVGIKRPHYCLFGDTVNTASRIQTHGLMDRIHVSDAVASTGALFGHEFDERGEILLKGKGKMLTYWLRVHDP